MHYLPSWLLKFLTGLTLGLAVLAVEAATPQVVGGIASTVILKSRQLRVTRTNGDTSGLPVATAPARMTVARQVPALKTIRSLPKHTNRVNDGGDFPLPP
jgi:hypothetical protein